MHRPLRFEPLEERRLLSITVNTLADQNNGSTVGGVSLREAIAIAAPGETIEFAPSLTSGGAATIRLIHGELLIDKDLTIMGPGAWRLTITARGNDPTPNEKNADGSRVFKIDDGQSGHLANVTISKLRLTGGDVTGDGGAIFNAEQLVVSSCVIENNAVGGSATPGPFPIFRAGIGGGLYNEGGTLEVVDSVVRNNELILGYGVGGGIGSDGGSLVVSRSLVSNNSGASGGCGINVSLGDATIVDSQIIGNLRGDQSIVPYGGGVKAWNVDLSVIRSTIAEHGGFDRGAGIHSEGGTLEVLNSTIDSNLIIGSSAKGAGIYRDSGAAAGPAIIAHSTIVNNTSNGGAGGGIYVTGPGELQVTHSIVAGNHDSFVFVPGGGSKWRDDDIYGAVTASYSLIGDGTGASITDLGGNQVGSFSSPIDPVVSALGVNGGITFLEGSHMRTRVLSNASPALHAGNPSATGGVGGVPSVDQRGTPWSRVFGGRIDLGAVESQPLPGDYNVDGAANAADYVVWRKLFGTSTSLPVDGNQNGFVDDPDYAIWQTGFGIAMATTGGTGGDAASDEMSFAANTASLTSHDSPIVADSKAALAQTASLLYSPKEIWLPQNLIDYAADVTLLPGQTTATLRSDPSLFEGIESRRRELGTPSAAAGDAEQVADESSEDFASIDEVFNILADGFQELSTH